MWKTIASRISLANIKRFNTKPPYRRSRSLWYHHCFENPTTSSSSSAVTVIQNNSFLNVSSSSSLFSKNYLHPLKLDQRRLRFMSNSTSTSTSTTTDDDSPQKAPFVIEGISEDRIIKAVSLLNNGVVSRYHNNNDSGVDDVSDVLVNHDFFIQVSDTITIPALSQDIFLKYAEWLCYSDDFDLLGILHKCDQTTLVSFLRICCPHKPKLAHAIYAAAPKDRIPLETVSYLIHSLSKHDDTLCLALDLVSGLSSEARNNATGVFSSLIRALCKKGDVEDANSLLQEMIAKGPPPGVNAFTDVINSICQLGDLERAFEMLKLMESRGLKPNVGSYRLLFKGYEQRGMMEQASEVVSMAKNKHPKDEYVAKLANRFT